MTTPFYQIEFRTFLLIVGSVLFIVMIGGYIAFQARFLIAGPQINVTDNLATQHNVRTIVLRGTAHNITHLWLNDRQIFTNEAGYFEEALTLENGYTIATIKAHDRFGRETRIERPFVYTPVSINSL